MDFLGPPLATVGQDVDLPAFCLEVPHPVNVQGWYYVFLAPFILDLKDIVPVQAQNLFLLHQLHPCFKGSLFPWGCWCPLFQGLPTAPGAGASAGAWLCGGAWVAANGHIAHISPPFSSGTAGRSTFCLCFPLLQGLPFWQGGFLHLPLLGLSFLQGPCPFSKGCLPHFFFLLFFFPLLQGFSLCGCFVPLLQGFSLCGCFVPLLQGFSLCGCLFCFLPFLQGFSPCGWFLPLLQGFSLCGCFFPLLQGLSLCGCLAPLLQGLSRGSSSSCCFFLCFFCPLGQDPWAGRPSELPGLAGGPLPLFSSSGVGPAVWVRGRPPGHPLSQGVPLPQGLPFLQGLLALITRGCPFLQGFVPVFKGFARKKNKLDLKRGCRKQPVQLVNMQWNKQHFLSVCVCVSVCLYVCS